MIRTARAVALVWLAIVAVLGSTGSAVAMAEQPVLAAVTPAVTTDVYSYDAGVHTSDSSFAIRVASVAASSSDRESAATSSGGLTARPTSFVAADTAGSSNTIVLGHYPEYVDVAQATGGRTFQVPVEVWDSMTPEEQGAANQKFLDRAIASGSNVQLATPADAAREGSYFEREIQYLESKGYTVGPGGMSMIAPGLG